MKKLQKLARKSNLMDIAIQYGKDKINFNLYEELVVNENRINEELKHQPSYYGFLAILLARLKRTMEDKRATLERVSKELFVSYKEEVDTNTGRPYSNDLAESMVVSEPAYIEALSEFSSAEEDHNVIKACVDAFTQRSHLVQTLSANMRKINE